MPSMTVTVTDVTKTPLSLNDLAFGASTPGYTVVKMDVGGALPGINSLDFLAIQASYGNAGAKVYVGGSSVKTDGTSQSRELYAGDTMERQRGFQPVGNLGQWYVTASANNAVFNVEYE